MNREFAVYCSERRPEKQPCVGMLVKSTRVERFFVPGSGPKGSQFSLWDIGRNLKQRYGSACVIMIWDGRRRHIVEQCTQCA